MKRSNKQNMCRLCLSPKHLVPASLDDAGLRVSDMLFYCCGIHIAKLDGLPQRVCKRCLRLLKTCFDFKIACRKADSHLRNVKSVDFEYLKNSVLYASAGTQTELEGQEKVSVFDGILEGIQNTETDTKQDASDKNTRDVQQTVSEGDSGIDTYLANNTRPIRRSQRNVKHEADSEDDYDAEMSDSTDHSPSEKHSFVKKSTGDYKKNSKSVLKLPKRRLTKYVCEKCGYAANDRTSLNVHYRSHTGERPYVCSHCQKRFAVGENLKAHMRQHTGERPFVCHTCGKTFPVMSSLRGHLRTHSGEKPYSCNTCGRRFSLRSNMLQHARTHTIDRRHACMICSKCFNTRSELTVHSRTHTGEKPHECAICKRRFSLASNLTSHLTVHTGRKEYLCGHCDKTYRRKGSLSTHIRNHHMPPLLDSSKTSSLMQKGHGCHICDKRFAKKASLKTHLIKHKDAGENSERNLSENCTEEQSELSIDVTSNGRNMTSQLLAPGISGSGLPLGQMRIQSAEGCEVVAVVQRLPVVSMSAVLPITVVPVTIVSR